MQYGISGLAFKAIRCHVSSLWAGRGSGICGQITALHSGGDVPVSHSHVRLLIWTNLPTSDVEPATLGFGLAMIHTDISR